MVVDIHNSFWVGFNFGICQLQFAFFNVSLRLDFLSSSHNVSLLFQSDDPGPLHLLKLGSHTVNIFREKILGILQFRVGLVQVRDLLVVVVELVMVEIWIVQGRCLDDVGLKDQKLVKYDIRKFG